MAKQLIVAKLFEFGGSNTHLKALIKYFGSDSVILLLEHENQIQYLNKIIAPGTVQVKVVAGLRPYAHLAYPSSLSNIKEALILTQSMIRLFIFCLQKGIRGITVNSVEPEKYLYFFFLPFIRIQYIVHSTPEPRFTWFTSFTCNKLMGRRNRVISVSDANKAALCEAWRVAEKKRSLIAVIHNCVAEVQEVSEYKYFTSEGSKNIVTMGHLISYKNPYVWLKVAKKITEQFANAHFIWLGNGPLFDDLKKEAANNQRISFPGVVDNPRSYLENATIYYQPSLQETHGIAVLEAMSLYLPCVVSNTGGLPESVQDGLNGILVPPDNIDLQVEALTRLLVDPELCKEYGTNGYKRCRERFSFENFKDGMDMVCLS